MEEERYEITLEILEKSELEKKKRWRPWHEYPINSHYTPPFELEEEPLSRNNYGSLSALINRLAPLPLYTTILGICDDGLPLLLDLSDPTPGSILITGKDEHGKARLLKMILASASALNPPQRTSFYLITPNSENYLGLKNDPHCRGLHSSYERRSSELIIELAELAEQRRSGRNLGVTPTSPRGMALILAIDNLGTLLQYNGYEVLSHLKWLAKYGPYSYVWPVVSANLEGREPLSVKLLEQFHTRISQSQQDRLLPGRNGLAPISAPSADFVTRSGNEMVRFWLPDMG